MITSSEETNMPRNMSGVREANMIVPALLFARESQAGKIKTSDLIEKMVELFKPTGKDAQIAKNRSDTYFSQKVRNLVSHKKSKTNLIGLGYASHFKVPGTRQGGIIITAAGRDFLKSLGA
jgi:hypothetical protein